VNTPRLAQADRPGLGVGLIVAMAACFATSDTLIKYMGGFVPVLLLLWARYVFQAGVMAVWLLRRGGPGFRSVHPKFQWMRGTLLLVTSGFAFFGLQLMPVAEFTALGMLTPVVVTMLAAWVLHETVSPLRWALVVGGFLGAVIVIRPGSGVFGWASVLPLLMALCYGCFQVLTSRLASLESPYTTHFYTGFSGALMLTPLMLFFRHDLLAALHAAPLWVLWPVLAIGLFATAGHLLLIFAFGVAPMATLMPFIYIQIAWALVTSWIAFRHLPDGWAWCGMAVIAACGAVSAWLNVRRAGTTHLPDSVVAADTIAD
jgi:drug/metabolite transporter (DMT)-like permease